MARHRERRIENENGEYLYRCSVCEEYKPKEEMTTDNAAKYSVGYYCHPCKRIQTKEKWAEKKQKNKIEKNSYEYKIQDTSYLNLTGVAETDYEETKAFLATLGYNPNEPIYPQFKKRIEEKYGVLLD